MNSYQLSGSRRREFDGQLAEPSRNSRVGPQDLAGLNSRGKRTFLAVSPARHHPHQVRHDSHFAASICEDGKKKAKKNMEFTSKRKREKVKVRVSGFAVAQEKGSSKQHEVSVFFYFSFLCSRPVKKPRKRYMTDLRDENSMGNRS